MYLGTKVHVMAARKAPSSSDDDRRAIDRIQTGVRIERRILNVLKALAASHEMTLGDLIEGIVLHAFEGAAPFGRESLARIAALKTVYGLDLDAKDSHLLVERKSQAKKGRGA
jgi:predicted DNA-binding ribbon-helix-helix protein